MLRLTTATRVFVATSPVHFSKGVDGLVQIVRDVFGEDPFSGHLFCFFNRSRNRVKLLVWNSNGFWLMSKHIEGGRFEKIDLHEARVEIDSRTLVMLLEGISTRTLRLRKHFARDIRIASRSDGRCERTAP